MRFRFLEWEEKRGEYNLLAIINCDDYDTMVKTLRNMMKDEYYMPLEIIDSGIVDQESSHCYQITNIYMKIPGLGVDMEPHFCVIVEGCWCEI